MNNQAGNYGRAPAPGNHNIYPPELRAQLDPQYQAALEYEQELRLRRELELQQDMDLRRRLQSLASQQIVEELEYRNQLQQIQNQQSQQINLSNLMAQNLQQQQYGHGDLLASLQDEYLLQRHQQELMMQDQMQQRLIAEGLAQVGNQDQFADSHPFAFANRANYGAAAAYLEQVEQEALRAAALATDDALIEQARNLQRQAQELNATVALEAAAAATAAPTANLEATMNAPASKLDLDAMASKHLQAQTEISDMEPKSKEPSKPPARSGYVPAHSSAEREDLLAMAKALANQKKSPKPTVTNQQSEDKPDNEKKYSKKSSATEDPVKGERIIKLKTKKRKNPGEKKEKKPVQELTKYGKLDGRTKKARALKKEALEEQRKLTDQEQSVAGFLVGKSTDGIDTNKITKRTKEEETKIEESGDDFAAEIVLNFKKTDNIPTKEIRKVNAWSKKGAHKHIIPQLSEKDYPELTPHLKFNLPLLPSEPEPMETSAAASKAKVNSLIQAINSSGIVSREDESALILTDLSKSCQSSSKQKPTKKAKTAHTDKWWPTDESIKQERRLLGINDNGNESDELIGKISITKQSLVDAKKRLENSVEPGVLELLPYCRLYQLRVNSGQSGASDEPKFCFQVANMFPDEPMVCCSKCSTWRHTKCGGHYKRWTDRNADPSNAGFDPVCDSCFLEEEVLKDTSEHAANRIEKQRIDHLRRSNSTNAVIQQFAFARHFQSKWPLGNVAPTHFAGHVRGVQARHEKSDNMWVDMVNKLELDCSAGKSKDRVRNRSRVLERLLHSVEDAETNMDIHNMILFLQHDTSKPHPVGFENFRRNIFDPEEDPAPVVVEDLKSESTISEIPDGADDDSKMKGVEILLDSGRESPKSHTESGHCARIGCQQKPRFDSAFCSDSCGVNALETDLLYSLKYAQELHPSVLRSGM